MQASKKRGPARGPRRVLSINQGIEATILTDVARLQSYNSEPILTVITLPVTGKFVSERGNWDGRQEGSQDIWLRPRWDHDCRRARCCGHRAGSNQRRDDSCRYEFAHVRIFPLDRRSASSGAKEGSPGAALLS